MWSREPLAPWDAVWGDVQGYDRETVLATAADVFRGLESVHGPLVRTTKAKKARGTGPMATSIPAKVQWAGDGPLSVLVQQSLAERLGGLFPSWYGHRGWCVGNETFGGCRCCALPRALADGPDEGARWVAAELDAMRSVLCAWAPVYRRIDAWEEPETLAGAVQNAAGDLIDVMVDGGWLNESWYRFVDDGACWLVGVATGLRADESPLRELASGDFKFTSWTAPSDTDRSRFAEHVAALVQKP